MQFTEESNTENFQNMGAPSPDNQPYKQQNMGNQSYQHQNMGNQSYQQQNMGNQSYQQQNMGNPSYQQQNYGYGQDSVYYQPNNQPQGNDNMTLKDWIITLLIMLVPLANIVMLFIWAFGKDSKGDQKNWAKAYLIILGVILVLSIVLSICFGAFAVSTAVNSL